jgi:UDP-glucose 4-epimerase
LLEDGADVYVLDDMSTGSWNNLEGVRGHERLHVVVDSVTQESIVNELVQRIDQVYHLAAVVGVRLVVESPVRTLEVNLKGTENVLKLAHRFGKRVLLASTSEVYGRHPVNRPLRETDERVYGPTTVGRWSYAAAKALDEFLGLAYHTERQAEVTIVRLFNTVGPRQTGRYGMVIPRLVQSALEGDPLQVYGTGRQTRSFTHVSDVVWALTHLMQCDRALGQVLNVGHGREISILELAERVKALTRSNSPIKLVPYEEVYGRDFEDMEFRTPCIDKIREYIGYQPKVDLDGILQSVVHYAQRQRNGAVNGHQAHPVVLTERP